MIDKIHTIFADTGYVIANLIADHTLWIQFGGFLVFMADFNMIIKTLTGLSVLIYTIVRTRNLIISNKKKKDIE